ncbi:MAG: SoxR reducing system RseC family protein [Candidatus Cyclobacteriaceae bacterium M3_2C_046]
MSFSNIIEHQGVVKDISAKIIKVSIVNTSACVSCQVKSACAVSEVDNKIIEVANGQGNNYQQYAVGDKVKVQFDNSLGFKALFLGYILPFIVLFTTLIVVSAITGQEGLAGLIALAVLVPYYLSLILFNQKLKSTFTFRLSK